MVHGLRCAHFEVAVGPFVVFGEFVQWKHGPRLAVRPLRGGGGALRGVRRVRAVEAWSTACGAPTSRWRWGPSWCSASSCSGSMVHGLRCAHFEVAVGPFVVFGEFVQWKR